MNQIYAIKHAAETENIDCEFELRRSYDVFIDDNVAEQVQQDFQTSFQAGQRWTREVDFVGDKYAEQVCWSSVTCLLNELTPTWFS